MRKVVSILKKYKFTLKDLDCANCANKIQNKLAENKNYKDVVVNFNTLRLSFESDLEYDEVKENIVKVISELEPEVEVLDISDSHVHSEEHEHEHDHNHNEKHSRKINTNIVRLLAGIIFMIVGVYITLPSILPVNSQMTKRSVYVSVN